MSVQANPRYRCSGISASKSAKRIIVSFVFNEANWCNKENLMNVNSGVESSSKAATNGFVAGVKQVVTLPSFFFAFKT